MLLILRLINFVALHTAITPAGSQELKEDDTRPLCASNNEFKQRNNFNEYWKAFNVRL